MGSPEESGTTHPLVVSGLHGGWMRFRPRWHARPHKGGSEHSEAHIPSEHQNNILVRPFLHKKDSVYVLNDLGACHQTSHRMAAATSPPARTVSVSREDWRKFMLVLLALGLSVAPRAHCAACVDGLTVRSGPCARERIAMKRRKAGQKRHRRRSMVAARAHPNHLLTNLPARGAIRRQPPGRRLV